MADDLGTSGSRGSQGARDEYDENAPPRRRARITPQAGRTRPGHGEVSALGEEPEKGEPGPVKGRPETPAARRTRGGSSYQHSLSARGIKSSGRERSCSDENLLSSMERLERATRLPSFDNEETDNRRSNRAFGRHGGGTGQAGVAGGAEKRVRGPRFEL